jgi:hypothetical protein
MTAESSIKKKAKNNPDDVEPPLKINELPDDVLIEIIKMLPMAQWASLERVNHQFQKAVHAAWRSIKEIKLDKNFVYNRKGKEYRNNRLIFYPIFEKLVLRTPNLTSISGTKIWVVWT